MVEMPPWGEIKKLTQKAEVLHNEQHPFTSGNMAVSMMALLTVAVSIPLCGMAPATNFTYWAYVPIIPLLSGQLNGMMPSLYTLMHLSGSQG